MLRTVEITRTPVSLPLRRTKATAEPIPLQYPTPERLKQSPVTFNGDGRASHVTVQARNRLLIDAMHESTPPMLSAEHRFYGLQITTLHYIALAVMDYRANQGYESTPHADDPPEPPSDEDQRSESLYHWVMRKLTSNDRKIIERVCFQQQPSTGDLDRAFTALGDQLSAGREYQENNPDGVNYAAFKKWKETL